MAANWSVLRSVAMAMLAGLASGCGSAGDVVGPLKTDASAEVDLGPLNECAPVFGAGCASVWPSFVFQKAAKTATGVQNDLMPQWFPASAAGKAFDVAAHNLRDGVSPVSPVVILPPKPIDPKNLADETKPEASLAADSPTWMVDAASGQRIRHIAELDLNAAAKPDRQALILRPYAPLGFGKIIVVGLSDKLLGKDGKPMPRAPDFDVVVQGKGQPKNGRLLRSLAQWKQDTVALEKAGLPRANQVAAWHLTTASAAWVTGPAVDLRDRALAKVGAKGLGLQIQSIEVDPAYLAALPSLQATPLPAGATLIVAAIHPDIALRIKGLFELPDGMAQGQAPESTLNWLPDGAPKVALQTKTTWRPFALTAGPKALQRPDAPPLTLYGHGFLRSVCAEDLCVKPNQPDAASRIFAGSGAVAVGTDWWGLSGAEIGIALGISADFSQAPRLTEKLVHGAVSFIALSRAVQTHIGGDPRFVVSPVGQPARPLTDGKQPLRYTGNSLGGIMGTTMVALHPDIGRAVLNVAGGVWSTMMNRSSNFAPFLMVVAGQYPDPFDQQVLFALMQTHWDLSDPVHFAPLVVQAPLPGTVAGRVALWPISWGDSQVPALASSFLARAAGATLLGPPVAGWVAVPTDESQPFAGKAAFVQWDSLRGTHPPGNLAPDGDNESHYATRWMPEYWQMVARVLYGDGQVDQRYCLGRDTDGKLPCSLKQEIPKVAKEMAPLVELPPKALP
ncbi:MAG: hypothetical protein FJ100_06170 [Deltaproteobacteria bacterium]|nr:hypothetical protein [Deltaproteobacteria bacterium]